MSKRSKLNRRRAPLSVARPRRIAPTFPLILTGLLGLSGLRAFFDSPVAPASPIFAVLTNLFETPRLYAQTPAFNAFEAPGQSTNSPQTLRFNANAANAPQTSGQNQAVFFSILVAADAAVVYSGPSEDAYSTGTVGKNRYVEAYFRSENGWCAIRPPQGSFSWVNAKFVRRESDSTGRIVSSGGKVVPSRVGAATVEESAFVQVGLKNGAQIKILDETQLSDGSTWMKILPPSGEFRWIHSSDLAADPAIAQLPTKLTFQREFLEQLARTSGVGDVADNFRAASNSDLNAPQVAPQPFAASLNSPQNARNPQTSSNVQAAQTPQTAQTSQTPQVAPTSDAVQTPGSEEFATQFKLELARLNADVFQTLRQNPPSDAELALLASRAETLFDAAPTDGERFVVQSIYDAIKIAERRNRSGFGDSGASGPRVAPNYSDPSGAYFFPNSPNPNSPSNFPQPLQTSEFSGANRFDEANLEGDVPLLVLPDSSFAPSDGTNFNGSTDARFSQSPQSAGFNRPIDVSQFFPSETASSRSTTNAFNANGGSQAEKRPRLAFAFSNANNPFRSRSSKGKEAQIAPSVPQNGGRAAGISKLPPLLPTQKQLIVPPPNYRSGPFGQNVRANGRLVAAAKEATNGSKFKGSEQLASTSQTSETTQDLTTETVRWRAVDPLAVDALSSSNAPSSSLASSFSADNSPSDSAVSIVSATNQGTASNAGNGRATLIGATATAKTPVMTGATAPKSKTGAASQSRKFQPVSSQSSAAFDASGVLARLPKAPKGAPQYALTRRVGDRFEVVSYLEAENGVSLEPYVGRHIGVKGTLGTIQIGEDAQKITTVQTVFERD